MTFLKNFRPGTPKYDQAAAIYEVAGGGPFIWSDLSRRGLDIQPGHLVALRNTGILTHPPEAKKRRRWYQSRSRSWILTSLAIIEIQRHIAQGASS